MMDILEHFHEIRNRLPVGVRLVVVSKTKSIAEILTVYHAGHRIFGENKAQELLSKQPLLPTDIHWHFIGHLQTNKVKYLVPFITMIESVDSLKLLSEINRQALRYNRTIDCLLQFHIATEETKFGLSAEEAGELMNSAEYKSMANIRIKGVMGMATFTEDKRLVRNEFITLRSYFNGIKKNYFRDDATFSEISMGMSGDWDIAVEEGATIVRIGTAIFGEGNL